jgi:GT2 family glycosyltransferase
VESLIMGIATTTRTRPGAPPPGPALGVVIVNFRGASDTIECLESLLRSSLPMKVVVVENGSGDGSAQMLLDWAAGRIEARPESPLLRQFSTPPVRKPLPMAHIGPGQLGIGPIAALTLIESPDNLGFAGGNNLGLRHLLADRGVRHVWLLNNDTVVMPEAAGALLARMEATPNIGMCGTIVRQYWQPELLQALNGYMFNKWTGAGVALGGNEAAAVQFDPQLITDATDFVLGASLAVSRAFVEDIGLMEESYFLYFEEIDWATRNRKRDGPPFGIAFAHGATVFHKAGAAIGSPNAIAGRSPFSDYWMTRSRLRFIARHYRWLLPWHWLFTWIIVARRLIRRQWSNAGAVVRAALGRAP